MTRRADNSTATVDNRTGDLLHPSDCDHDGHGTSIPANLLATLIEQLQENWDRDDNAANDELVIRIREHIRRGRPATARPERRLGC